MAKVKLEELVGEAEDGTVEYWCCQEGDQIAEGDDLLQIETSEGSIMVTSPYSGTVEEIFFAEGETVGIGDVLCEIDDSESN